MRKNAVTPCILAALFDIAQVRRAPSPMHVERPALPQARPGGIAGARGRARQHPRRHQPRPVPIARSQVSPSGRNGRHGVSLIP